MKNPYEGKMFFDDSEIWDKGGCMIGDVCFGDFPGEKEKKWFKFGSHKQICAIIEEKKLGASLLQECATITFLGKNISCEETKRINCKKYRQ